MDGRVFDAFLRDLSNSRRSLLGTALAAAGVMADLTTTDAKKKKKKKACAKKCRDGCCTSKFGKCIKREQQSSTQCGAAGEICRTNCEGLERCGPATCNGCCDGATCEASTAAHCGRGAVACVVCGAKEDCGLDGKCCGLQGHACGADENCCLNRLCDEGKCCSVVSGACDSDPDCCNPDRTICENGECRIQSGLACEPLEMCPGGFLCPGAAGQFKCCAVNGHSCTGDPDCCEDEDICDGGVCKRREGDFCNGTIICQDAYPNCVQGACRKCPEGQQDFGTDEVCCQLPPTGKGGCSAANGGAGACCTFEDCCKSRPAGVCLETEFGTPSC